MVCFKILKRTQEKKVLILSLKPNWLYCSIYFTLSIHFELFLKGYAAS